LGVVAISRPITQAGNATSQSDFVHEADRVRATQPGGYDGSGIRIGALSNSYDRKTDAPTHAAQDIASGDLPAAGVAVPHDHDGPFYNGDPIRPNVTDEGRAILEIIHDLAPGSPLSFSSGFFGEADFANQIRILANPTDG